MTRGFLTAVSLLVFWVLTAAVLIFVGLTGNALLSANDLLGSTDTALTSVKGHTDPLTDQVHIVNGRLVDIEAALQPIHGQADQLNPILSQVQQTLATADPVVTSIENHASAIEGRLIHADGLAKNITNNAAQADGKVNTLQNQHVPAVNAILVPIQGDLAASSADLASTSSNLRAVCNKVGILGIIAPGGTCSS